MYRGLGGEPIKRADWLTLHDQHPNPLAELRTGRLLVATEYQGLEHGVWLTRAWLDGGRARGRVIGKERSETREQALDAFRRASKLVYTELSSFPQRPRSSSAPAANQRTPVNTSDTARYGVA